MPKMLWKMVANRHVRCFANRTACMASYVFESWMMSLNVHLKSQMRKVLVIMDDYATHSLEHVGRGESFGSSTL